MNVNISDKEMLEFKRGDVQSHVTQETVYLCHIHEY